MVREVISEDAALPSAKCLTETSGEARRRVRTDSRGDGGWEGTGHVEEMKEAWGEMGSPTDPIRLTFRSDWWFWVVSAPDCFLPSCQSPSLSSQVSLSII